METKNKNKPITPDQVALIPSSEYLTYKQAVSYMGHGDDWFYRMVDEFNVVKTSTGYYPKSALDEIKKGGLKPIKSRKRGERMANRTPKPAVDAD